MQWKLINKEPKTYAVLLSEGEEVMESLNEFVQREQLAGCQFSAIGAFSEVVLGHFNLEKRGYKRIPIPQQVEVLSLTGQVTLDGDQPHLHAQVVVGRSDASAHGGHLIAARVRPVLEVIFVESASYLRRFHNEERGMVLLGFEETPSLD
jgi:predicted DNA-binding protein with PD1-like motif